MAWRRDRPFSRNVWNGIGCAIDHTVFQGDWGQWLANLLARRVLRRAVDDGLRQWGAAYLDGLRAWLRDPDNADPWAAPPLLRNESQNALRQPNACPMSFAAHMTLRQWCEEGREWALLDKHYPYADSLTKYGHSLIEQRASERMRHLPEAPVERGRRRL